MIYLQPFFPFIIFIVVFFAIFYVTNRKRRKVLRNLSNQLNGSISNIIFCPTLNCEYQGLRFFITLIPPGKSSPPYLKISLIKDSSFKLMIYKEGFFSHLGEKLRIIHKIKTNDESFDRDFLVFSNNPAQAAIYFNNENMKNTIKELFNNGFYHLLANGKRIIIQKPDYI